MFLVLEPRSSSMDFVTNESMTINNAKNLEGGLFINKFRNFEPLASNYWLLLRRRCYHWLWLPESELLIREMKWSTSFTSYSAALSHMNGLLLQVSCCYEELRVSYQYVENRRSLIEMFKERSVLDYSPKWREFTVENYWEFAVFRNFASYSKIRIFIEWNFSESIQKDRDFCLFNISTWDVGG